MEQEVYGLPISPPDDPEAAAASPESSASPDRGNMASIPTPLTGTTTSPNERHSVTKVRRDRTPPRNSNGDIYCDHQQCSENPPIFRRNCEWNKHMDRHERPYKCQEPECAMSQGFTYSGGLLRHEREVHRKNLTGKEPLYCPFPGCNRGSGTGFTRKENLEEHKRRKHQGAPPELLSGHARKRKRPMTPQPDVDDYNDLDTNSQAVVDADVLNHPYVKWLHKERVQLHTRQAEQDSVIQRQAVEINRLQNMLGNIPTQTIYGVPPKMMSQASMQRQRNQMHTNGSAAMA